MNPTLSRGSGGNWKHTDRDNVPKDPVDHHSQCAGGEGLPAALPVLERCLYICGWCGSAAYSCYSVYTVSRDSRAELNDYDFTEGWKWFGRQKDVSNFEWDFWSGWFVHIVPWYIGHLILGQVMRWFGFQVRGYVFLVYSMFVLGYIMGVKMLGVIILHCVTTYLCAWWGSTTAVWAVCILLLATLNYHPFSSWLKLVCDDDPFEKKYYLLVFTLAMTNLRYISFCMEWCDYRKKIQSKPINKDGRVNSPQQDHVQNPPPETKPPSPGPIMMSFSFIDMLMYCFYFPLFFGGPILTYNLFYQQLHSAFRAWDRGSLFNIICDVVRVMFWAGVCEGILHYFYFNSIQHNVHLMERIPLWALAGVGYCHGQFFMVKYVVMFGLPRNLARFDQLEPPLGPRCIAHIYRYSEMWKYFDRGLYSFMKRHIYIPLGGSHEGVVRQTAASALCFLFVYFWHGAEDYLLMWTLLNFIGISLEVIGAQLATHLTEKPWFSPAMNRRVQGIVGVPLLAMSAIAIFTFFGGKQTGFIFYQRLIRDGWPVSVLTIYIFLYCFVQTSIEIRRWKYRKMNKND